MNIRLTCIGLVATIASCIHYYKSTIIKQGQIGWKSNSTCTSWLDEGSHLYFPWIEQIMCVNRNDVLEPFNVPVPSTDGKTVSIYRVPQCNIQIIRGKESSVSTTFKIANCSSWNGMLSFSSSGTIWRTFINTAISRICAEHRNGAVVNDVLVEKILNTLLSYRGYQLVGSLKIDAPNIILSSTSKL